MDQGLIPHRYAKALYKLACERGKAERFCCLMQALSAAFAAEPDLDKAVTNPFVSNDDKMKLLSTAAGTAADDTTFTDFLKLLIDNRRIDMVRLMAIAYEDIYRKANNIRRVNVVAAAPLAPQQEKRLKELIEKHLGDDKKEYETSVDTDLIGGFVVNIDSERLDASVKNELKQLQQSLLSK